MRTREIKRAEKRMERIQDRSDVVAEVVGLLEKFSKIEINEILDEVGGVLSLRVS